jgi:hypothetical protein
MNKWKIILATVLAVLVLIATPLAIMAQGQTAANTSRINFPKVHLAIIQPWGVRVGQEMQLTVFERLNQGPAEEAGVWIVSKDKIDAVKQAIKGLAAQGLANINEANYENILNAKGTFLDHTDSHGKIFHTFTEAGNYALVALKPGYLPGYSVLAVRDLMAISAPKKAAPRETVIITVNQKDTSDPVIEAEVWVVDSSEIKTVKEKVAQVRITNKGNLQNVDWESELRNLATKIGHTDNNGQITNQFDTGKYLLVAVKPGSVPAYTGIAILEPSKTLSTYSGSKTTLN